MHRLIPVLLPLLLLVSCKKDCCTIIDTNITIQYINESGEDLFKADPRYAIEDVRIHYKQGASYKLMYDSRMDNPDHFSIDTSGQQTNLSVYTSYYYEGNFSTTLVELNETTVDTILAEYRLEGNSSFLKKLWYNGELKEDRGFVVVK